MYIATALGFHNHYLLDGRLLRCLI
jgi:hypothetical protein